ncbi:MAG: hypothetical protein LBH01_01175 [Verrucomicrobiales bacterium]|jgi:hypothetical protein|nr:hypothetical protein [Verrucomicrobiales bacterium]
MENTNKITNLFGGMLLGTAMLLMASTAMAGNFNLTMDVEGEAVSNRKAIALKGENVNFNIDPDKNLDTVSWDFGTGATPPTASGYGPHAVSYGSAAEGGESDVQISADRTDDEGNNCSTPMKKTASVVVPKFEIKDDVQLWWFGGEAPQGYETSCVLEITPALSGQKNYTITGLAANFEAGGVNYATSENSVGVVSVGASTKQNDITVKVEIDGGKTLSKKLTINRPLNLVHLNNEDNPSGQGYESKIYYKIEDQFGNGLPEGIGLNEEFTSGVVSDYQGSNWPRGGAGGAYVNPASWCDTIGVPYLSTRQPLPLNPSQNNASVKVDHFTGHWRVGSSEVGKGMLVENYGPWSSASTCKWQRYRGYGRHE